MRGKKRTGESEHFRYSLEENLRALSDELQTGTYRHGSYRTFTVSDTKKRNIAVAPLRDRLVHRLLYDYLVKIFDETFLFEAWSCRKGKGLMGAIEWTQRHIRTNPRGWFWRGDIHKFFDHVDHGVLSELLERRVENERAFLLLSEIIGSYSFGFRERERERERAIESRGIPIGNVTSQIFANVYLHEFDRFVKQTLGVQWYVRYGDDFTLFAEDRSTLMDIREKAVRFLAERLHLGLHERNDVILPCRQGLRFLGSDLFPSGGRLRCATWRRMLRSLQSRNIASYSGLVRMHGQTKKIRRFDWHVLQIQSGSDTE